MREKLDVRVIATTNRDVKRWLDVVNLEDDIIAKCFSILSRLCENEERTYLFWQDTLLLS